MAPLSKQLALYLWKTGIQKSRGYGQTLCEILAPVILVALFAWLYLEVDKSIVPDATFECSTTTMENAKYDFVYLPRVLNLTATRLAIVGDDSTVSSFKNYLYTFYPGISASSISQLGCSIFELDGSYNNLFNISSAYVPSFDTLLLSFTSESDLEAYIADPNYGETSDLPAIYAAVVFEPTSDYIHQQWQYKIRVNASNIPDTHTSTDSLQRGANLNNIQRYVAGNISMWASGPPHPVDNRMPGFVAIQLAVDRFIMNSTNANLNGTDNSITDAATFLATWNCSNSIDPNSLPALTELNSFLQSHALFPQRVRVTPFPASSYTSDSFYSFVQSVFALVFVMSFFFPSFFLIRGLVVEKETRVREGVRMMGMSDLPLYGAWYIIYATIFLIIALCVAITCVTTMFSHCDGGILILYFWLFGLSSTALCFALSTLFSRAKLASIVGAVIFIATFFPYFSVNDPLKDPSIKSAASLCSPVAFGLALDIIATLESNGVGVTWSNIGSTVNNYSFGTALLFLALDTVIYTILGWYLNLVFPQEFGIPLPWYFFLESSYWFPLPHSSSHNSKSSIDDSDERLLDSKSEWSPATGDSIEAPGAALCELGRAGRGVTVRGLRKEFAVPGGTKVAVDNVDLDIFEGQIFVLLGHNGAGKTTTISMLTGVIGRSAGTCEMYGVDIANGMSELRQDVGLGVCPQHDVLWADLTVEEHLLFFAGLKGLSASQADTAARTVIREVGLTEKVRTLSKDLSGGMKRKLSVAIALVGDSKVVFLDEPTSGMDPYSRRSTWQILQNARQGRSIILTTHFMDEADLLGDRIAIMADGNVRCCGSSMYLKKLHGVGYNLTMVKIMESGNGKNACDSVKLEAMISSVVPEARLLSNVGAEISFQVPLTSSSLFPSLFSQLEAQSNTLGVLSYGISVTTLEEVFLKVAEGRDGREEKNEALHKPSAEFSSSAAGLTKQAPQIPRRSDNIFWSHLFALLRKRWQFALRDRRAIIFQLLIPIVALSAGLALLHQVSLATLPAIELSLQGFNGGTNYVPYDDSSPVAEELVLSITNSGFLPNGNFPSSGVSAGANFVPISGLQSIASSYPFPLLNNSGASCYSYSYADGLPTLALIPADDLNALGSTYAISKWLLDHRNGSTDASTVSTEGGASRYVAFSLGDLQQNEVSAYASYTALVNTTAFHTTPTVINMINSGLYNWLNRNAGASIRVINAPLPFTNRQSVVVSSITSFVSVLFVVIAFSFIPSSFAVFVVKEREVGAKHQQLISGVSIPAYWVSTFIWDIVNYSLPCAAALILVASFGVKELLGEALPATALLFILYGTSVASFTYCTTYLFSSHSTAQTITLVLNLLCLILLLASYVMHLIPATCDIDASLRFVYRLVPGYSLGNGLLQLTVLAELPFLENNCGRLPLADAIQQKFTPFSLAAAGWPILFMSLETIVYFLGAILIDVLLSYPQIRSVLLPDKNFTDKPSEDDDDVIAEARRVQSGKADKDTIVVKGLRKVYAGGKVAVRNLSFGLPQGECFGFLGINGAGKTTTMKILTGDVVPTIGGATLAGFDILKSQTEVRRLIGYCPQFDALLELVTVKEHLELFARIKGVPENLVAQVVNDKIQELDLTDYSNMLAGSLSGGNKRKLSVAIAMIGGPILVFLDEPSTGMDPVARRFMWNVISRISSVQKGCSIILTTHSMEEAEALCTKIGIMVGGRLRCLGSTQHLKSKFGKGYLAVFKLASAPIDRVNKATEMLRPFLKAPEGSPNAPLDEWRLTAGNVRAASEALGDPSRWRMIDPKSTGWALSSMLKSEGSVDAKQFADWWCGESLGALLNDFVKTTFRGAELAERHGDFFRYKLPSSSGGGLLSSIFSSIESKKSQLFIQEYSLSQVDLESVFNLLASQQEEERIVARGVGGSGGSSDSKVSESGGETYVSISTMASINAPSKTNSLGSGFVFRKQISRGSDIELPGLLGSASSESYVALK
jgi:ATP-binding cassette, subfamily A (ABC1), member 3